MTPIAIRGVGLCCALGLDADSCVTRMLDGGVRPSRERVEGLAETVEVAYHRIPDGAALFDPARFERLLPEVVRAALAGSGLSDAERRRLPIYIGSSCYSIGLSEARYAADLAAGAADAVPMPRSGYGWLADLAAAAAGSGGASFSYNTACTASANALLGAARALASGRHRHALVVGGELANRTTLAGFAGLQLVADAMRPFAADRGGLVLGEGIGAVLLSAQVQAGDYLLHGGASNCDTFSVTTANPDGSSVADVLRRALGSTATHEVRAIRAHGTATSTGDAAEASGLRQVFTPVPALSALKPYLGHTLGACGVNELVLYLGALQRGLLPALPGPVAEDRGLGLRPLVEQMAAMPGRYLLNHFGFGGSNTVLVLEKP